MLRTDLFVGITIAVFASLSTEHTAHAQNLLDKVTEGVSGAAKKVGEAAGSAGEAVLDAAGNPTASEINSGVDAALEQLYASSPEAKALSEKSIAILVFPTITKGGLMVGGQFGEGAMRENGETTGYYSIAGASYGFQAGIQHFSYAMFFLDDAALEYFRNNDGWEAGTGPTLVGGDHGWSASMGTNDLQGDIVPIVFGQEGLMAGTSLQGTKITRIDK
ncbi:YSC84-related protein [Ruegeria denitrificans]|uniref:lipid-binding SYLF domain-containing protein n=1 Tax=Ruegeria denitrificans TaxID=1715692 RepID=UPI003C7E520B